MTNAGPESATTLLVIAKQPVPGRVKTRLVPPCTHEQAAALAEAALSDTLHTVLTVPARRRVLVLDGRPGPWLPPGFDIVPQCGGPLDERLAAAFAAVRGPGAAHRHGHAAGDTKPAFRGLASGRRRDGPAADGGFWALGLRVPDPGLLRGVPMSTASTGAIQRSRLLAARAARRRPAAALRDVDTAADALAVAGEAPRSLFAARARELAAVLSGTESVLGETA